MEHRSYESASSLCCECGSDLGRQTVWTVVFADDPRELVAADVQM
jgi:hypothetical protein